MKEDLARFYGTGAVNKCFGFEVFAPCRILLRAEPAGL
jgi:hypothetical protein